MKKKMKFSGASIKRFFIENGEKLGLGVTAVVLLAFLYAALTAEPLSSDKPKEIVRAADDADKQIKLVDWEAKKKDPELRPRDFNKEVQVSMTSVPEAPLAHSRHWDNRLFPDLIKRADPEVFPPQELQIAGGYGIVPHVPPPIVAEIPGAIAPPAGVRPPAGSPRPGILDAPDAEGLLPGAAGNAPVKIDQQAQLPGVRAPGAEPRAKFYAIITGLVPTEKQAHEYQRRFEYAVKDPERTLQAGQAGDLDVPRYRFFFVERAEVKDAKDTNVQWQKLDYKSAIADIAQWAVQVPEIVDPLFVFPADAENTYITWPLPPLYLKNWGLEAAHPKVPLQVVVDPRDLQPNQNNNVPFNPFGPGGAGGAVPGMEGGPRAGGLRQPGGVMGGMAGEAGMTVPAVPHRLFRYVDLTAEPGKTYRYRVQLLVYNPNFGFKPQFLEKADSSKEQWRYSPWSEPTAAVTIPRDYHILAESVAVPRVPVTEPAAKFSVLTLLKNPVVEAMKSCELPLGGVALFKDVTIENVVDMSLEEMRKVGPVNINTDLSLLLDVRNDEPLGGNKTVGPTEMVFVDKDGRLVVTSSAADGAVQKDFTDRTTVQSAPSLGGFGEGDGSSIVRPPAGGLLPGTEPRRPVRRPRPGSEG